ncbi:unnamed protein product [Lactuca saligna]|uniref:Uncharacterized protein n=1 Tax=Lactuca saligna TaxID=75948 RepID=A0AA35UNA9_LACSI|nr:unnamed protein product [Lactuca saligna]
MGEGVSHTFGQCNPSLIISSTFETFLVDTSISLPPFTIPTSTKSPPSTHSPTFDNVMNQPITSLFSSQSTDPPLIQEDDDQTGDDDEFDSNFADIEFHPEEENIPNNMLLTGKHLKILI